MRLSCWYIYQVLVYISLLWKWDKVDDGISGERGWWKGCLCSVQWLWGGGGSAIIFWRIILILITFMIVTILIFRYQSYQYPKYSNNLYQGGIAGVWVIPRVWGSNTSKDTWRQILSISKGKKSLTNHKEN